LIAIIGGLRGSIWVARKRGSSQKHGVNVELNFHWRRRGAGRERLLLSVNSFFRWRGDADPAACAAPDTWLAFSP